MGNDLSRQLCELCGIERKGKLIFRKRDWDGRSWISAGCGYKEFDFKSIPEIRVDIIPTKDYDEKNGFQYPYSDIERIKREYDKNGYDFVEFSQRTIDFTKPENFKKLFELKIHIFEVDTTLALYLTHNSTMATAEDFLENLLFILEKLCDLDTVESIKQSIREAEWVYE